VIAILLATKNEATLLRENVAHHLGWGIDHVCVADNASTDATADVCASFGGAVSYQRFDDFHQRQPERHRMLHRLLDDTGGAVEWAAISDTDEFFFCDTPVRDLLADVPDDVVAVNFDAKLFLPTGLDPDEGSVLERRTYRTIGDDNPLHTSYTAGKTFYRSAWLASLPIEHNCKIHEHLCLEVPHERFRHEVELVHHYMIQDEDQFVEKVVRLIEWARPPAGRLKAARWRMTPKERRPLPGWEARWKKNWWAAYQHGGVEEVRRYYRESYVVPAADVPGHVAAGRLRQDDALAAYTRRRVGAGEQDG
jgi:glycosyltransferase involved in cell wall biosynthesis